MHFKKYNAFTLIEIIVVVMMIGILMTATTMYLGGSDEKRKTIEAQGCANSIGGEINNFLFYTLTSKHLKLSETENESPNYYIIEFTGSNGSYCSSGDTCDKINLSYSTGDEPTDIKTYKTITISTTCQQNNQDLVFYRSGIETNYIIMNRGFSPKSINDKNVFYLKNSTTNDIELLGDIIIGLCLNSNCDNPKEIGKFVADARSQTVYLTNCKFYDVDTPTKCKTRENCQIYDSVDPTKCQKY